VHELRRNRFQVKKALVIAPKKVAEGTWTKEARKWDHLKDLRISIVLGTAQQRIRALNTPADLYVINRENTAWLVKHYQNAWPFDMVIVDESTSFKNPEAVRFKALSWVRIHIRRMIILTGTPAPRGLIDLWAQVYLLDEGQRLGDTIGKYRERFFYKTEWDADYKLKPGAEEEIYRRIGDICISMKAKDYIELPERIDVFTPVALDRKAQIAYNEMEKKAVLQTDEGDITAVTAAVLTNKLLQLCNGAAYDEDRRVIPVHECKMEAFMELVESLNGEPALVFYNFQHDRDRLLLALAKTGLRIRQLKGPKDEDDWNAGEIDILLAHPASTAYGLNLQDGPGHHIVWFGLNWSLELYQQANKRLHRQGQQQPVIVHHLIVEGGMDETVRSVLEQRGATQDALIEALKARVHDVKERGRWG